MITPTHDTRCENLSVSLFDGAASLRWLGTNCLFIRWAETTLLIDPHFSRPGLHTLLHKIRPDIQRIRRGLDRLGVGKLDGVLITHTHYDHFLDAFEAARLAQANLYGSESVLRAAGPDDTARVHAVQAQKAFSIGSLTVTFFPTRHLIFPGGMGKWLRMDDEISQPLHPPAWFWQYRAGIVYNLLIEFGGCRLYLQGSAGLSEDITAIPAAEAAVLGIGALGFKSRFYLRQWYGQAVEQTGATEVYLSHWDNFFRPWNAHPRDLPGTGRVICTMRRLAAGRGDIRINRLPPG